MNRTTFATSGFRGSRRAASRGSGQTAGRNNRFITRRQRYGDMRRAFGLAGG